MGEMLKDRDTIEQDVIPLKGQNNQQALVYETLNNWLTEKKNMIKDNQGDVLRRFTQNKSREIEQERVYRIVNAVQIKIFAADISELNDNEELQEKFKFYVETFRVTQNTTLQGLLK